MMACSIGTKKLARVSVDCFRAESGLWKSMVPFASLHLYIDGTSLNKMHKPNITIVTIYIYNLKYNYVYITYITSDHSRSWEACFCLCSEEQGLLRESICFHVYTCVIIYTCHMHLHMSDKTVCTTAFARCDFGFTRGRAYVFSRRTRKMDGDRTRSLWRKPLGKTTIVALREIMERNGGCHTCNTDLHLISQKQEQQSVQSTESTAWSTCYMLHASWNPSAITNSSFRFAFFAELVGGRGRGARIGALGGRLARPTHQFRPRLVI